MCTCDPSCLFSLWLLYEPGVYVIKGEDFTVHNLIILGVMSTQAKKNKICEIQRQTNRGPDLKKK